MDKSRIDEQLDLCRPDSRDLELPELALLRSTLAEDVSVREKFERVQRLDRALARALQDDVAVPEGLTERILAGLAHGHRVLDEDASDRGGDVVDQAVVPRDSSRPVLAPATHRRRAVRRGLALAALASCVVVATVWMTWRPALSDDEFASVCLEQGRLLMDSPNWNVELSGASPSLPVSSYIWLAQADAWQSTGGGGVAYRLRVPGRAAEAVLLVRRSRERLTSQANMPPASPNQETKGFAVGVWQEDAILYALVVPGQRRDYESLTRRPSIAFVVPETGLLR
ncbi:MAG: hypothetical protein KDA60_18655 [Planctomycetales bacterium]|nr:hypothetical protein [Planctomycetales bacterium]